MSVELLGTLEQRVEEAAQRMASLHRRNNELEERVTELETALASAAPEGTAGWEAERDELRQRVAALVERLESLLAG